MFLEMLRSLGIEKNPIPPHYKIEKYIEKSQIPFCHIRPSFFMQNISDVHAFEIKHFNKIFVPAKKSLTSFISAEDIGEFIAHIFCNWSLHKNTAYSLTGYEAIDYYQIANILSTVLNRKIYYANPSSKLAKKYWIKIRGLNTDYAKVMSLLYLMTRLGTAKKITHDFEKIMNKKPQSFEDFAKKNINAW